MFFCIYIQWYEYVCLYAGPVMWACLPVCWSSDTMQIVCQKKFVERALFILLSELPSLKSICFGSFCFLYAKECFIQGERCKPFSNYSDFPKLQSITFKERSFTFCKAVAFKRISYERKCCHPLDLPALKEIVFDNASYALQGDGRTDNKTKINGMQSYDNTLEMIGKNMIDSLFWSDLPKLASIRTIGYCRDIHFYMGSVILNRTSRVVVGWFLLEIPKLKDDDIHYGENMFYFSSSIVGDGRYFDWLFDIRCIFIIQVHSECKKGSSIEYRW